MANTRGIHWIVTTHGTWVHGDPRGSWRSGSLVGPDPFLEASIRAQMSAGAVTLTPAEQMAVGAAFGRPLTEMDWRVYAATVRSAHCHLVFAPLRDPIDTVIATLKHRAARDVFALRRQMKLPMPRHLWTTGKFPVFIYDDRHLRNAIA